MKKFNLQVPIVALAIVLSGVAFSVSGIGVAVPTTAPTTGPTTGPTTRPVVRRDTRPIGVIALSDALNDADPVKNPHRFQWSIVAGPKPTLGGNVVWWVDQAAKIAADNDCQTLIVYTGFGGSKDDELVGYSSDVLDPAPGITVADERECFAAIARRNVRPGVIIRPQRIVQGLHCPKIDGSDPAGTLNWQATMAGGCGAMDFYADSNGDEIVEVAGKFPGARFLIEFWQPGCAAQGNVFHWRGSSATFTNDRPQAVQLKASDVDAPAKVAAWGKLLRSTNSTVILNCRPDDPTLAQRQAPALAAWKASQGKGT